ncbi:MAG: flagellar cap protein FliD N-terminal domain-containing protein, partial [Pseudomonadota bacterium]
MAVQSLGIGSGLLTTELLEGLLEAERSPVEQRLNNEEAVAEAKISAFGEVRSAMSVFAEAAHALSRRSSFNVNTADSSNESVVSATAERTAEPGSYSVDVSQLARSQSLASGIYQDVNDEVGTGKLNFRF